MLFTTDLLPSLDVEQVNADSGRYYRTPAGNFRSVTTILGDFYGTKALDEWRKAIGADAADAISTQAARQGTIVHNLVEKYLLNQMPNEKVIPLYYALFLRYKEFLDKSLTSIYAIEHMMYSAELKTAGTTDLIGRFYDHYDSVCDYKTVRKMPARDSEKVEKYHIQMTAYAIMVEELFQKDIPYNLVLLGSQDENKVIPYIVRNDKYRDKVRSIFNSVM